MVSAAKQLVWFKIWYRPRSSVRTLLDSGRGHGVALVSAALFGLVQSLRFYLSGRNGPAALLAGAALGVVGLYFFAWLLRNFGRWFQASASLREMRTALGIALIPWTLLFAALSVVLQGTHDPAALAGMYPFFFAAFLYGYVVLLLSASGGLNLGVWKTFLCLVVTALVSLFPLTLLVQLLSGVSGSAS